MQGLGKGVSMKSGMLLSFIAGGIVGAVAATLTIWWVFVMGPSLQAEIEEDEAYYRELAIKEKQTSR